MRRLLLTLLLPLLLLITQQGGLQHGLVHMADGSHEQHQGHTHKQQPGGAHCDTCWGFAHVALAAKPALPTFTLLAHLSHHQVAITWASVAQHRALAPRNRGPPPIL